MIDPHSPLWAVWAMMNAIRHGRHDDEDGEGGDGFFRRFSPLLTWAHVATTVSLVVIIANTYTSYRDERANTERRIAVIEVQQAHSDARDSEQDRTTKEKLDFIIQRLDAQRSDLLELRQELTSHTMNTKR